MEKVIWVLGSEHLNAHKSISWNSPFPNFSNCDILIVNLQSLDEAQFEKRRPHFYEEARKYIFDFLMAGEKEVFIISSLNQNLFQWLPIYPHIQKIARGEIGGYNVTSPVDKYIEMVEDCPYYIRGFNLNYASGMTHPESPHYENYPFTEEASLYRTFQSAVIAERTVLNKAKQMVGGSYRYLIKYGDEGKKRFTSGFFHFLPPPTRCTAEQAIDIMVNILTGGELIESPPTWETKIDLPELQEIARQIVQKGEAKEKLIEDIHELRNKEDELIKFRRLLWTDGTPLENAVKDAFVTLGFSEMRKIREKNLEDWVIDLKFVPEYKHGVFEIKGSEKRTSLSDLNQCDKWVRDYLLEKNLQVKGIFVSNQYRRDDIRTSLKQREHFEENELKFARQREICILPSHEIFNAIMEKRKATLILPAGSLKKR